jgi:uncharacterized membrane protein
MTIRNPIEWGAAQLGQMGRAAEEAGRTVHHPAEDRNLLVPAIRHIGIEDLREALRRGIEDFGAYRTDVIFLGVIYPIIGLVLGRAVLHNDMQPLLFPLASGFALIGPFAAIGLYEMSRRREQGAKVTWIDAFGVVASPAFGAILAMGLILFAIFVVWLAAAQAVYMVTLGPEPPASFSSFVEAVFTTGAGWAMIGLGIGVGFLFAVLVLAISVVSFPLLLDRRVGVDTAIWTSVRAVAANPATMAAWGLIVAASLVVGSIPLFIGLIVVMPVLGHATWHLYRKVVAS